MLQRNRDLVAGPLTLDYLVRKIAEGWRVAAVEWVREAEETTTDPQPAAAEEIPYGLRLADDGSHLEQHPIERTVLLLILDGIVRERRITEIALDLNADGLSTRQGSSWSPTAVFDLLPRLIEAGPSLLKSHDWQTFRNRKSAPN